MANTHTHTQNVMANNDSMAGKSEVHGGNGTLGTVFEEMDLHGKPYAEAKTLYVHTEASHRDI